MDKTIRNVTKKLREAGVLYTVYRRSSTQNGRSTPVQLFVDHPYYFYWEELLDLGSTPSVYQTDCQAENAEIPCVSKEEEAKFNTIRKEETYLDASFTPSYISQTFVAAVKMFYGEAKVFTVFGAKRCLPIGKVV
ncbi:hypothetical protein [Domibacillus mangrovi]|uniref:hypothetical protein n=1 Tax=Domibacillus mangrovi TaxID=1714354 RepID=UPI0013563AF5|nr:hypothetical protein [Domibacillus mangrovi]